MSDIHLGDLGLRLKRSYPTADIRLPIRLLGEGYASRVVETSDGVVFKLGKNEVVRDAYRTEYQLLLLLAAKVHRVRIPYPEYYIHSSDEFPFGLMGYHKLNGAILNPHAMTASQLVAVASSIADFLFQIHRVDISTPEILNLNLAHFPPPLDIVRRTWANVADWLRANLAAQDYNQTRGFWQEAERFWEAHVQPPRLTHGDIWLENVVYDPADNTVGVLDFGSVRLGDEAIDFALQVYVSAGFRDRVINEYIRLGGEVGENLEKRMDYLLALREIYGLEYGLMTHQVDRDAIRKIKRIMLNR